MRNGLPAAAILLAVAAAAIAGLAAAYRFDPVAAWDEAVARWVAGSLPDAVEEIARPFTLLGGGLAMAAVAIVAAVRLERRGRRAAAVLVVVAYVGAQASTHLLKWALDRPRPTLDPATDLPSTAAYPSGHAATAVAVLVVTATLLGRGRAIVAAVAIAAAIGLSRVALGVHWLSDVVGGWALGSAWVGACLLVDGLRARRARR